MAETAECSFCAGPLPEVPRRLPPEAGRPVPCAACSLECLRAWNDAFSPPYLNEPRRAAIEVLEAEAPRGVVGAEELLSTGSEEEQLSVGRLSREASPDASGHSSADHDSELYGPGESELAPDGPSEHPFSE